MRYVIVTGTSQGLGEAIAVQLLEENTTVISITSGEKINSLQNWQRQTTAIISIP